MPPRHRDRTPPPVPRLWQLAAYCTVAGLLATGLVVLLCWALYGDPHLLGSHWWLGLVGAALTLAAGCSSQHVVPWLIATLRSALAESARRRGGRDV